MHIHAIGQSLQHISPLVISNSKNLKSKLDCGEEQPLFPARQQVIRHEDNTSLPNFAPARSVAQRRKTQLKTALAALIRQIVTTSVAQQKAKSTPKTEIGLGNCLVREKDEIKTDNFSFITRMLSAVGHHFFFFFFFFLVILTNFGKDILHKVRKPHAKTRI